MSNNTLSPSAQADRSKRLIAEHFLTVLCDHNWKMVEALLTDDTTLKMPGTNQLSGVWIGKDDIVGNLKVFTALNPLFYLKNIQISYSGFAISLQIEVEANGKTLSQQAAITCSLQDDKIAGINFYLSHLPNLDAFFGGKPSHPIEGVATPHQSIVANTFLTALRTEDWEMMGSIMEEAITWTLPGESLLSGPANGIDAVVNRASSLKRFGVMFQLLEVLYGWDGYALSLHNTASRKNLLLDEFVTIAFMLDDSRIRRMTTHLSDVPGIEAFFVPGIID